MAAAAAAVAVALVGAEEEKAQRRVAGERRGQPRRKALLPRVAVAHPRRSEKE